MAGSPTAILARDFSKAVSWSQRNTNPSQRNTNPGAGRGGRHPLAGAGSLLWWESTAATVAAAADGIPEIFVLPPESPDWQRCDTAFALGSRCLRCRDTAFVCANRPATLPSRLRHVPFLADFQQVVRGDDQAQQVPRALSSTRVEYPFSITPH